MSFLRLSQSDFTKPTHFIRFSKFFKNWFKPNSREDKKLTNYQSFELSDAWKNNDKKWPRPWVIPLIECHHCDAKDMDECVDKGVKMTCATDVPMACMVEVRKREGKLFGVSKNNLNI